MRDAGGHRVVCRVEFIEPELFSRYIYQVSAIYEVVKLERTSIIILRLGCGPVDVEHGVRDAVSVYAEHRRWRDVRR